MVLVFILISPFAFASLILSGTAWFFKSWLKLFLSLLFLQLLIPLILIIAFSFDFAEADILSKLIYLGSVYALIKANSYLRDFMGGLSTDVSMGMSGLRSMFTGGNI